MRLLALGSVLLSLAGARCGSDQDMPARDPTPATDATTNGYVLFSPLLSTTTYLVDRQGRVVHRWESDFAPGAAVYLLDNGNLLRCGRQPDVPIFRAGGQGGRIQEFRWDGTLVWDWVVASADGLQHHDIEPLANGNVLVLVWESKTREEALQAGRRPDRVGPAGLWPDAVLEVRPIRPYGGVIVWEWHLWDHLIQDFAPKRENYGQVSEHPERVDINGDRQREPRTAEDLQRLRALGYLSQDDGAVDSDADFVHTNSIAYHSGLDQIALSVPGFNEIWILDHGTSTREAAGRSGGRAGRGGDLLYRWGNPGAYARGTVADRLLFAQHDARWIPPGFPGADHLLVFNNGQGRPQGRWSSVLELAPPLTAEGAYELAPDGRFGPGAPVWEYTAPDKRAFYADFISGAHRLVNGNTFITSGPRGRFFEVTPGGETVWEYVNPFSGDAPNPAGDPPYSVFRATHLAADHPGLAGRDLAPLVPQPPPVSRRQPFRSSSRSADDGDRSPR